MKHWGMILLVAVLLAPVGVQAQCAGFSAPPVPFAKEVLTITDSVTSLSQSIYQSGGYAAVQAIVTLEGGAIRYDEVGTPTATTGHYVATVPGMAFPICGLDSIRAFKAVRVATQNATASITYYRTKSP